MSWSDVIHALQTSVPAALAALGVTLAAFVEAARRIAKAWRSSQDKRMQEVPPVAPQAQPNPFGSPPPTDPTLIALAGASHQASQAVMQQARFSLDELRKALEQAGKDQGQMSQQIAIKDRLLARLQLELEAESMKRATAMAAVAERDVRIAALEAERDALEQRIPTPLRPPRLQER